MSIFNTGDYVGGYKVQSLIKQNEYTETYKTVNANEQPYFLKVYIMKRTPAKLVNNDSHEVLEIALLQKIQHVNVVSHIAHGSFNTIVGECQYLVTNYFTGEVLADKIAREGRIEPEKAVSIFMGILEGLKSLHDAGICHNDITPSNIMLSDTMDGAPEIIDLGHASQARLRRTDALRHARPREQSLCQRQCGQRRPSADRPLFGHRRVLHHAYGACALDH